MRDERLEVRDHAISKEALKNSPWCPRELPFLPEHEFLVTRVNPLRQPGAVGQLHVRVPGSSQHRRGEAGMGRNDAKDSKVGSSFTQKTEVQRAERVTGGLDEPKRPKIPLIESELPVRDRSGSPHENDLTDMYLLMVHPEVVTQVVHVGPERKG